MKTRKKSIARHRLPLAPSELRAVMAMHMHGPLTTAKLAARARVDASTMQVVVSRLRRARIIHTDHELLPSANGRRYKTAIHDLTSRGEFLTRAWETFLEAIGPSLRQTIGWTKF